MKSVLNKSVYNAQSAPALCVIEGDVDHGTLYISQFVCIRQAEACDPMGMEVVDEVADLFAQE